MGPYDFVNLVEAPDNDAVFGTSVGLGSSGNIKILTMPAITVEQLIKRLKYHLLKQIFYFKSCTIATNNFILIF